MRRIRPFLGAAGLILALVTAAPAGAAYSPFQLIFFDYQTKGQINPCKWTGKQLASAKKEVPNDIDQYAPDFEAALDAAIEKRAAGGCRKGSSGTQTQTTPSTAAPTTGTTPSSGSGTQGSSSPGGSNATTTPTSPTVPPTSTAPTPAPAAAPQTPVADDAIPAAVVTARDGGASDTPLPLLLLALLCALLAVAVAVLATVRWWAFEPAWYVRARHAGAEAGWRASATWAEFTDWLRLGR